MLTKDTLKKMRAINREAELASGIRLTAKTIPSKLDKARCPKRQRKTRSWLKGD